MVTDLTRLSDEQLSAAVAVECMGMTQVLGDTWVMPPNADGLQQVAPKPAYATDPTQATELWDSERVAGRAWEPHPLPNEKPDKWTCTLVWEDGRPVGSPSHFWHSAPTWPRALCLAVLARKRSEHA